MSPCAYASVYDCCVVYVCSSTLEAVRSTPRKADSRILAARTILRAEKGDRRFYRLRHMRSAASALFRLSSRSRASMFQTAFAVLPGAPGAGGGRMIVLDRHVTTARRDRAVIRMCWCG